LLGRSLLAATALHIHNEQAGLPYKPATLGNSLQRPKFRDIQRLTAILIHQPKHRTNICCHIPARVAKFASCIRQLDASQLAPPVLVKITEGKFKITIESIKHKLGESNQRRIVVVLFILICVSDIHSGGMGHHYGLGRECNLELPEKTKKALLALAVCKLPTDGLRHN